MRILLTGGAGFIGSHLAKRLLNRGDDLVILDNFNHFYDPRIKEENIRELREEGDFQLYRNDLLEESTVEEIFSKHSPELIIHLAAYAGVRPSLENPALYFRVNVTGSSLLFEAARRHEVEHFIFGSSSSVYGVNTKVPFHEDDPLHHPISPYAISKRAGELLGYSYFHNYGLPVTCLRFFTVYGPRQRPEMGIYRFTDLISKGEEIPVYHEGKSQRDYTYVDDIVEGILAAAARPRGFEIYNLGNSRTVLLIDLIRLIEQEVGRRAEIRLLPAQKGDVPVTYADISRAREELSWVPATPLEEGIRLFVEWFRSRRVVA